MLDQVYSSQSITVNGSEMLIMCKEEMGGGHIGHFPARGTPLTRQQSLQFSTLAVERGSLYLNFSKSVHTIREA